MQANVQDRTTHIITKIEHLANGKFFIKVQFFCKVVQFFIIVDVISQKVLCVFLMAFDEKK